MVKPHPKVRRLGDALLHAMCFFILYTFIYYIFYVALFDLIF